MLVLFLSCLQRGWHGSVCIPGVMRILNVIISSLVMLFCLQSVQASDNLCVRYFAQQFGNTQALSPADLLKKAHAQIELAYQQGLGAVTPSIEIAVANRLRQDDSYAKLLRQFGMEIVQKPSLASEVKFPSSILQVFQMVRRLRDQNIQKGSLKLKDSLQPGISLQSLKDGKLEFAFFTLDSAADILANRTVSLEKDLPFKIFAQAMAQGVLPLNVMMLFHDFVGHLAEISFRPELQEALRTFYRKIEPRLTPEGNSAFDGIMGLRSTYFAEFLTLPNLMRKQEIKNLIQKAFSTLPEIEAPTVLHAKYQSFLQGKFFYQRALSQVKNYLTALQGFTLKHGGGSNDGRAHEIIDARTNNWELVKADIQSVRETGVFKFESQERVEGVMAETILGHIQYAEILIDILKHSHPRAHIYFEHISESDMNYLLAYHLSQIHIKVYWAIQLRITDIQIIEQSSEIFLDEKSNVYQFIEKTQHPDSILYRTFILNP